MVEKDIGDALYAALAALGLPNVAYENVQFSPAPRTRWYRPTLLPARPRVVALGGGVYTRHEGIFSIDIFSPLQEGDGPAIVAAAPILAAFKPGTYLSRNGGTVRCNMAYRLPGSAEEEWYMTPIRVEYQADILV